MPSSKVLSETEVFQLISRHAAGRGDRDGVIANHLLCIPGVHGIVLNLSEAIEPEWLFGNTADLSSSAWSEVRYGSWEFGSIRVGFDPQVCHLSSPVKVARFAGQQIASVLVSAHLSERRRELMRQRESLASRIETRKIFARAVAVLRAEHGMSELDAQTFLVASARKSGKRILVAARAIIALRSGLFFRLQANRRRREESNRYARRRSAF